MLRARRVRAGVWRLVPSQPVHVTPGYGRPNKNAWLTTAHPTRPWDIGSTLSGAFTFPWLRALPQLVETTGPRPVGGPRARAEDGVASRRGSVSTVASGHLLPNVSGPLAVRGAVSRHRSDTLRGTRVHRKRLRLRRDREARGVRHAHVQLPAPEA